MLNVDASFSISRKKLAGCVKIRLFPTQTTDLAVELLEQRHQMGKRNCENRATGLVVDPSHAATPRSNRIDQKVCILSSVRFFKNSF